MVYRTARERKWKNRNLDEPEEMLPAGNADSHHLNGQRVVLEVMRIIGVCFHRNESLREESDGEELGEAQNKMDGGVCGGWACEGMYMFGPSTISVMKLRPRLPGRRFAQANTEKSTTFFLVEQKERAARGASHGLPRGGIPVAWENGEKKSRWSGPPRLGSNYNVFRTPYLHQRETQVRGLQGSDGDEREGRREDDWRSCCHTPTLQGLPQVAPKSRKS